MLLGNLIRPEGCFNQISDGFIELRVPAILPTPISDDVLTPQTLVEGLEVLVSSLAVNPILVEVGLAEGDHPIVVY